MRSFEPSNYFSPAKTGSWTEPVSKDEAGWLSIVFIGMMVLLIWGATVPELYIMCIFYLIMLMISYIAILFNYAVSDNPFFSTLSAGNSEKIAKGILWGIIITFMMLIINGLVVQVNFLQSYGIVDPSTVNLLLVLLPIPFIEELFSGAFLTPTFAEKGGIVFSLVGNILIFMCLHWIIYNANVELLFVSGFFRGITSIVQLHERSWLCGFSAHSIYNFLQTGILFRIFLGI